MSDLTTLLAEHAISSFQNYEVVCHCAAVVKTFGTNPAPEFWHERLVFHRVAHAAHVAEVIERTYAVVEMPKPNFYTADEELEWSYGSVDSDGIVNLGIHDGGVELSIGHDLGQSDAGLPTVAEGFIPLSLLRQTAAALLAAANATEGETHE